MFQRVDGQAPLLTNKLGAGKKQPGQEIPARLAQSLFIPADESHYSALITFTICDCVGVLARRISTPDGR